MTRPSSSWDSPSSASCTHDSDFGELAVVDARPIHGVLFLRPGDDPPDVVIAGLETLLQAEVGWNPPMIAAYGRGRLRVRRLRQSEPR
jgi:hypothetical protein